MFPGEPGDRVATQTKDRPFVVRPGTQSTVELNGRFIPIEHRPFHSSAVTLLRDLRQSDEECATVTLTAHFWPHEKVLQIKTAPPHPGGKIVKEKGEANRLAKLLAEQYLGRRVRTEKDVAELFFGRHDFLRRTFVLRQFADQGEDNWHVVPPGKANAKVGWR